MAFSYEIIILEIIGIVAFAISGAVLGIKKHFDILGIIILGVITAVGGGAMRDIILGINPPLMFQNPFYTIIAFITSCITFWILLITISKFNRNKKFFADIINFFDAIGLGIFAVTGTNTAILNGHIDNIFLCVFVGTITAVGGGMLRDILSGKVPFVLYKEVYATAAIIGALLYYILHITFNLNDFISSSCAVILTIIIRLLSSHFNLRLPRLPKIEVKK